jgi:hypothetical protein
MIYNAQTGKELMQKYLGNESKLAKRLEYGSRRLLFKGSKGVLRWQ